MVWVVMDSINLYQMMLCPSSPIQSGTVPPTRLSLWTRALEIRTMRSPKRWTYRWLYLPITMQSYLFTVRGGLTLREAICLMEIIHQTGRLRAVDLVEINPALGNESDRKRTLEAGLSVLKAALGFSRKGTAPRGVLDLPVQTHHKCN